MIRPSSDPNGIFAFNSFSVKGNFSPYFFSSSGQLTTRVMSIQCGHSQAKVAPVTRP